jgi:hypothetical protein
MTEFGLCRTLSSKMFADKGAVSTLVANVESSQIEQCLPPEVKYACLYWIQHL